MNGSIDGLWTVDVESRPQSGGAVIIFYRRRAYGGHSDDLVLGAVDVEGISVGCFLTVKSFVAAGPVNSRKRRWCELHAKGVLRDARTIEGTISTSVMSAFFPSRVNLRKQADFPNFGQEISLSAGWGYDRICDGFWTLELQTE